MCILLSRQEFLLCPVMELLKSGQDAGRAASTGEGQHTLPKNVFEANKLMELDHGRLFFSLKKKPRIQNTACCPTRIQETIATYLYLSDLVGPMA